MGLIRAGLGAASGVLSDQWKDYFYCEALDQNTLVAKGHKRVGGRSSNDIAGDNIISNGSGIAVADGQCMIIVEQGKIVEFCSEPGEFTYDTSSEPSIFAGDFYDSLKAALNEVVERFTFGGEAARDQRVYYFNTKEIVDNKFGTASPILFKVIDRHINLDLETSLKINGVYSYRIVDPITFYMNVCGNVESYYMKEDLDPQLKAEFISALQPALAKISALEVRPSDIPAHVDDLCEAMNEVLSAKWKERGIAVSSIALNPVSIPEEDQAIIRNLQQAAALTNISLAAANRAAAEADALRDAAKNPNGAANAFIATNFVNNAGGGSSADLFSIAAAQNAAAQNAAASLGTAQDTWVCPKCGKTVSGNFCPNCGEKRPAPEGSWTCPKCGEVSTGNFCPKCGEKRPASGVVCSQCGTVFEDGSAIPNFCPQCGNKLV
ncbi:MAG: SPFH domain-containing protein [Eubacteriaceae bacterium]|nr:SPFH domain-containing protein [Eubacteriaceae bacterium]